MSRGGLIAPGRLLWVGRRGVVVDQSPCVGSCGLFAIGIAVVWFDCG